MTKRPFPRVQHECTGTSKTQQSHKDETNIQKIMKRYHKTGLLPQRLSKGVYGDFTNVIDYQTCVQRLNDAMGDFAALPSALRKRFDNDPGVLINWLSDENNHEEARQLGLLPGGQQEAQGPSEETPPDPGLQPPEVPEPPTPQPATA